MNRGEKNNGCDEKYADTHERIPQGPASGSTIEVLEGGVKGELETEGKTKGKISDVYNSFKTRPCHFL